jgi:hypothetical protein
MTAVPPLFTFSAKDGGLILTPSLMGPIGGATFNGVGIAQSGIIAMNPGFGLNYSLTFTATGTLNYTCVVHYPDMPGWIHVVEDSVKIMTPKEVSALAKKQIMAEMAGPAKKLLKMVTKMEPKSKKNADGGFARGVHVWLT